MGSHKTVQKNGFRFIFTISLPVAYSYVPLGAAKSMLLLEIGIDWYWPIVAGVVVYAGALEYLLVSFMVGTLPLTTIVITSLMVNFRHLFYALSYPMARHPTFGRKLYAGFALTDEAYLLTSLGQGKHADSRDLISLHILLQFWWVLGSVLGVGIFFILPFTLYGFEFGLTAMFIVLATDSIRSVQHQRYLGYTVLAVIAGFVTESFWSQTFIIAGMTSLLIILSIDYVLTTPRPGTANRHQ